MQTLSEDMQLTLVLICTVELQIANRTLYSLCDDAQLLRLEHLVLEILVVRQGLQN